MKDKTTDIIEGLIGIQERLEDVREHLERLEIDFDMQDQVHTTGGVIYAIDHLEMIIEELEELNKKDTNE